MAKAPRPGPARASRPGKSRAAAGRAPRHAPVEARPFGIAGSARLANDACDQAFAAALALEDSDVDAAIAAYQACVADHADDGARANLGRLLHLRGMISAALDVYRQGDQSDPGVLYNQAVALEDLGRTKEAIATYLRVLQLDRDCVDAHHNLALLLHQAGEHRRAVRHWNAWRRLSRAEQTGVVP